VVGDETSDLAGAVAGQFGLDCRLHPDKPADYRVKALKNRLSSREPMDLSVKLNRIDVSHGFGSCRLENICWK
jgi:hypothetical protein